MQIFLSKFSKKCKKRLFWPVFLKKLPVAQKTWSIFQFRVFIVIWESSENQFGRPKKSFFFLKIRPPPLEKFLDPRLTVLIFMITFTVIMIIRMIIMMSIFLFSIMITIMIIVIIMIVIVILIFIDSIMITTVFATITIVLIMIYMIRMIIMNLFVLLKFDSMKKIKKQPNFFTSFVLMYNFSVLLFHNYNIYLIFLLLINCELLSKQSGAL